MKNLYLIFFLFTAYCFPQTVLNKHWLLFDDSNSPLSSNKIISVTADPDGGYWIVTAPTFSDTQTVADGYLHRVKASQWEVFNSSNSPLDKNIVEDIALTEDNKLLVATSRGLYIKTGNTWDSLNTSNSSLPNNFIYRVTVDKLNRYWLGIPYLGVAVYDNGVLSSYDDTNSFEGIFDFNFIEVDSSNNIWIGTDFWGLYSFDGSKWSRRINGLFPIEGEPNMIAGLSVDHQNNKWCTINIDGGGWKIGFSNDDSTWIYYDKNTIALDSLNRFAYESLVIDRNNIKWFGSRDGLIKFDDQNWSVLDSINSPIPSSTFGFGTFDAHNNKIYALSNLGLIFYNEDSVIVTSVDKNDNMILSYLLYNNYPNPFNPSTVIRYQIPEAGLVSLKVYDLLGREVATLVNEIKSAGSYEVEFNASEISSGVYFYQLKAMPNGGQAGNYFITKKMTLIK